MLKKTPLKKKPYKLKKSPLRKISERGLTKKEEKKEQAAKRRELFLEIWKEREEFYDKPAGRGFVRCFETGTRLDTEYFMENTCCYHHCLLKSTHPSYDLCKENIIIITPHIHNQVHTNIDKTPKVKAKTEELFQKHLNGEL